MSNSSTLQQPPTGRDRNLHALIEALKSVDPLDQYPDSSRISDGTEPHEAIPDQHLHALIEALRSVDPLDRMLGEIRLHQESLQKLTSSMVDGMARIVDMLDRAQCAVELAEDICQYVEGTIKVQ